MNIYEKHLREQAALLLKQADELSPVVDPPVEPDSTPSGFSIGMNLSKPLYFGTSFPFDNFMKNAKMWVPTHQGKGWNEGPELNLTADGYPILEDPTHRASTIIFRNGSHYPTGAYDLSWTGSGDIYISGNIEIISSTTNNVVFDVLSVSDSGLLIRINRSDPQNPVRDMILLHESYKPSEEYHKLLEPFSTVRLNSWMLRDNDIIVRSPQFTYGDTAVPLDVSIKKFHDKDIWANIPLNIKEGDPEYIRESLKDFKNALYVETTNEWWNWIFPQAHTIDKAATAAGISREEMYVKLAAENIEWLRSAHSNVVGVCGLQFGATGLSTRTIEHALKTEQFDAFAVAPYFGNSIKSIADDIEEVIMDEIDRTIKPKLEYYKDIIGDKRLIAYEGGPHMIAPTNEDVDTFAEYNRSESMAKVYKHFLEMWKDTVGDLFCHFEDIGRYSKSGFWGGLEYQYNNEPLPKWQALIDLA